MQNLFQSKITTSRHAFLLIALLSIILLLPACSSTPDGESDDSDDATFNMSAEEIYVEANESMDDGNFEQAVEFFEDLEVKYPYGPYAKQAKLEIIYAYFKYENLESSIIAADRFIKLYPNHAYVDYAYYMRGVGRYEMEISFIDDWFNQDLTERDPESARIAFKYFQQLIKRFPNSKYNTDAKKRMLFLLDTLSRHEIHVANYYIKRQAYIAAVNRAKYVINNYQKTPAIKDALQIMVNSYKNLKLYKLADDAQRVLDQNYPG